MICYKDKTFCGFWERCQEGDTCFRAATQKELENAKSSKLPMSFFKDLPECFVEK